MVKKDNNCTLTVSPNTQTHTAVAPSCHPPDKNVQHARNKNKLLSKSSLRKFWALIAVFVLTLNRKHCPEKQSQKKIGSLINGKVSVFRGKCFPFFINKEIHMFQRYF